ncbi:Astacin-like metalloendopeptidase [Strongyloides ratti]|uniref:Astacin-like metalloendopeptidase n=1 Tax=Strongyloides ratti TaxID=34506 RepID=A0A090KX71_STRRB|nr:Astacin-like metalloendopeptidase [Strongyloides ratti]CEF60472.1 Astacin-like metalloendopeptidase [Strongyloides ratti]
MNLILTINFFIIKFLLVQVQNPIKQIPYIPSFGGTQIRWYANRSSKLNLTVINQGLQMISEKSCVQFVQETFSPTSKVAPFIEFMDNTKVFLNNFNFNATDDIMKSPLQLQIEYKCNKNPGCIAKKVLFSMGMAPTIRRNDRDKFITLNKTNIIDKYEKEFEILDKAKLYGTGYDYSSIGHASEYYRCLSAQSIFNTSIQTYLTNVGQEYEPSFTDLKWLFYRFCSDQCTNTLKCQNGGFQNYDGCVYCDCPNGYSGDQCEKIENGTNCDIQTMLTATTQNNSVTFSGAKLCNVLIKTDSGKKIKIVVGTGYLPSAYPCFEKKGLTIKYRKDKGLTGISFCTYVVHEELLSEDETVHIQYKGEKNNKITITYQQVN